MQTQPAQPAHSRSSSPAVEPQLIAVPPDKLGDVFPHIQAALEGVAERSQGRFSVAGIIDRIARKEWILWVVFSDGAVLSVLTAELYRDVSGIKCCRIPFCTGNGAASWVHLLATIEDWARAEGCERFDMIARKGWAKHLPDYKLTHVLLEKDL